MSAPPQVSGTKRPFAEVLQEHLQRLYDDVLEEHNLEAEHLRNSILLLQKRPTEVLQHEAKVEWEKDLAPLEGEGLDSEWSEERQWGALNSTRALENWVELSEKLLAHGPLQGGDSDADSTENSEPLVELAVAGLQMRKAWTIGLQEASLLHRNRNYRISNHASNSTLRMRDVLKDPSILQSCVLGPRNFIQLLWSFLGSLFILWDLVTIPLQLFDIPTFIQFLENFGMVTFIFWILDMPTHLIFGREIKGKVELRPGHLAREYLYSWFLLDLMVISIDIGLFLVEELSGGWRSARFLRTLRLLRLLRLLRVAKLQQALTLLANRFLSAHAFMVMKVVAGLMMILAINHIIACCWYGIGSLSFDGRSWLLRSELLDADGASGSFPEAYAASIHWALTQFTPATNNIAPDNAVERFFAVWVILLAMGVFSSFISSITSTVSSLRTYRQEQAKKQAQLLRFFNERNLSTDLYGRVQDIVRKQGLFDVRLNEKDVSLFGGVPERLLVLMHEEMYQPALNALNFWPMWSHFEDQSFFRDVCHTCITEHVATPAQDAFMPGTDCQQVYVIQSGVMQYSAKPRASSKVYETVRESVMESCVLCLPCFWADWHHRGRLASEDATCYYVGIQAEQFCGAATKHGGPLWQFLQIFGILLVGQIESSDEAESWVTDLCLSEESMSNLIERSQAFAATVRKNLDVSKASVLNPLRTITRPTFSRSFGKSNELLVELEGEKEEILHCSL